MSLLDDLMPDRATADDDAVTGPVEVREAHVKAAVLPSEKPRFEHLAKVVHQKTMSDFIRDFLLEELERAQARGLM
jgi:hypothetical protein